jgi:hypothetical protein
MYRFMCFFAIFYVSGAPAGAGIFHVTHSGNRHIFQHQYHLNFIARKQFKIHLLLYMYHF